MTVKIAATESIREAASMLCRGGLVAFPTETVYGLGADATAGEAVAKIFAVKTRPRSNPLIVHVTSLAQAEDIAHFSESALRLAQSFWPGPLTLVLQRRTGARISDLVTAGLDSVAIRVPDHPIARALLAETARPVAAPSANRSGTVSPTRARHVADDLGNKVDMILDGGPTAFGIESTVLDARGHSLRVLRPGAVTTETIGAVLGASVPRVDFESRCGDPRSPGQLPRHYAPRARLRLNASHAAPHEALLTFGPDTPAHAGPCLNLSPTGDLMEAAANLFAALRNLDSKDISAIAVMPIPKTGLGEAINDRLTRAATPCERDTPGEPA